MFILRNPSTYTTCFHRFLTLKIPGLLMDTLATDWMDEDKGCDFGH